jgi:hypothetical protein
MTTKDQKNMLLQLILPLSFLILFYALLTAFRDFRDSFSRELWDAIGYKGDISVYTQTELVITVLVLILLGLIVFIKNNLKALITYHYLLLLGTFSVGLATLFFQLNLMNPFVWMLITGFGLYICYVPFNCIFLDRMIAAFKLKGNAGVLIYIADAFGYLGSILVLLYKNFVLTDLSWLSFFINASYVLAVLGMVITLISLKYFKTKIKKQQTQTNIKLRLTS